MKGYLAGLDAGSTTVKLVILDDLGNIVYKRYERHLSNVKDKALELLEDALSLFPDIHASLAVTGSAGMGLARTCDLLFSQEVHVAAQAVNRWLPGTDAVVELGGEDAKIIFFKGGLDQRMNGSCAGGTGAFIDQMATLLDVTPEELDLLAFESTKVYPVASRCGVFAKSDIQPLLNQGAAKSDVAASIFQAVVNQTVTGLAQGRRIEGNVAFLGGPLTFFKSLRQAFIKTLNLTEESARFPENAAYYVAMGAALSAAAIPSMPLKSWVSKVSDAEDTSSISHSLPPLFASNDELAAFRERHSRYKAGETDISTYTGNAWLGIDSGSTTTKLVLIDDEANILYQYYGSNKGNPLQSVHDKLLEIRKLCGERVHIRGSAVTGYGEDLMQNAFALDSGIVETVAHARAARWFQPEVDFILDIGGQDIKCFHIRNGAVDSIMLNEACSSGCGSFIETFAKALNYDAASFSKVALEAKTPVDLGTRCTVFMNSSIKQAQKEGASVADISAGLAVSVVRNALYKVIRINHADQLGKYPVVQGGTFLNEAVLRAFETETGNEVVRPAIAGLMGAYGAALTIKDNPPATSKLLSYEDLQTFSFTSREARCGLCSNHCLMTISTYGNGNRHFSGNRCSRPLNKKEEQALPNVFKYKYDVLRNYGKVDIIKELQKSWYEGMQTQVHSDGLDSGKIGSNELDTVKLNGEITQPDSADLEVSGIRKAKLNRLGNHKVSLGSDPKGSPAAHSKGRIGIPMVLNQYENLPFWHAFFTTCGYEVVLSEPSNRELYTAGQHTIPSDTVCYPAKLSHGHIESLLKQKVDAIFYPCLPYNFKETDVADNHFNCPVVAYYPELLAANVPTLDASNFFMPYFGLHRPKDFVKKAVIWFGENMNIPAKTTKIAVKKAYEAYYHFINEIHQKGQEALEYARSNNHPVVILAGRPYHVDPEVSHGIDRLLSSFGMVVLTEDSVYGLGKDSPVKVLNQWMYHSRLYHAACYAVEHDDVAFIQLVSFGCGLDAITTDEVREILEKGGKLYTQLKIDDIDNLGAVKIRIRSLMAAMEMRKAGKAHG